MNIPPLFRYMSCRGERLQWILDSLRASSLYMACPLSFNDAHEGVVQLRLPTEPSKRQSLIDNRETCSALNIPFSLPRDQRIQRLETIAPAFADYLSGLQTRKYLAKVVACSMSETAESPLMWAHYASAYDGVCLELSARNCDFLSENLEKVLYYDAPPTCEFGENFEALGRYVAAVKSRCWEYEQEWRLISTPPERTQLIARGAIGSVTIGQAVSLEDRWQIVAVAQDVGTAIRFAETDGYAVRVTGGDA